jgi:hypothetical protein
LRRNEREKRERREKVRERERRDEWLHFFTSKFMILTESPFCTACRDYPKILLIYV